MTIKTANGRQCTKRTTEYLAPNCSPQPLLDSSPHHRPFTTTTFCLTYFTMAPTEDPLTVLVVLGHKLEKKNGLWDMTNVLRCRLKAAEEEFKRLQEDGREVAIVLSGGDAAKAKISEAEMMCEYMEQVLKIPTTAISLEEESTNSYFNAKNSLDVIKTLVKVPEQSETPVSWAPGFFRARSTSSDSEDIRKVVVRIVTSKFHMPRALYMFKSCYKSSSFVEKVDCIGAPNGLAAVEVALLCQDEIDKLTMPTDKKRNWIEVDSYLRSKGVKPLGKHFKKIYWQMLLASLNAATGRANNEQHTEL